MKRVLMIPGGSSRVDPRSDADCTAIETEARRRGLEPLTFTHPGQKARGGSSWERAGFSDRTDLRYDASLQLAREICRAFSPDWIIGRSYGCAVTVGLMGCGDSALADCQGAVLWGPWFPSIVGQFFDTPEKMQEDFCNRLERNGTRARADFFDSLPDIRMLVTRTRCHLRFGRGEHDKYNSPLEMSQLCELHREAQPSFHQEVVHLPLLAHTVEWLPPADVNDEAHRRYMDCLFAPILGETDAGGRP